MKVTPSMSVSSIGLRASQAASRAKSILASSIDRSIISAHHASSIDFNKSDEALIKNKTIPMSLWNDAQMDLLANTVLQDSGFLSTYDDTMETKWKSIKWKLENSKNHEFVLKLPLWDNFYKQYKVFKRELLKHYEVKPTTMDTSHLDESKMPTWAVLIIKMEKYRIATFQVSVCKLIMFQHCFNHFVTVILFCGLTVSGRCFSTLLEKTQPR